MCVAMAYVCANAQAYIYPIKLNPTACDSAAAQMNGEFKKTDDYTFQYWNNSFVPAMTKRTDGFLCILKETFPQAKGFVANYYREMFNTTFIPNGPKAYMLTVAILPFGGPCQINPATHKPDTKKFKPASETDTWIYCYVNNPASFFPRSEKMIIQGEQHTVYTSHPYIGKWKGYDLFGSPEFLNGETWTTTGNVWCMVTRENDKAFTQLSRRQYLQGLLDSNDEAYWNTANGLQLKKNITTYLQTQPLDSLKLHVLLYSHRDTDNCEEWFNPKAAKSPPSALFVSRHAYWHAGEEEGAAQMIVMRFRYNMGHWNDVEIKKTFQQRFPIDSLKDMLDK
ncbi:MAG: hypothetical protein QM802_00785 [Agriterribacter sp.]